MIGRRALIGGGALAAVSPGAVHAAPPTLREAAARAGLPIGSSSEVAFSAAPDYAALIDGNCDLFAPNLSWQRLSPAPASALTDIDPNIEPARAAGLILTGYHLLWHQRLPTWFAPLPRADAERAIVEHISQMARHFGASTISWNVVNEAINPSDGRPDGLRRDPLTDKFGASVFDLAFHAAQAAAPDVLRVYNDYDLELTNANDSRRRATLLRAIDGMLRRSVPLQAIGLQCHLRSQNFEHFDPKTFRRFLADLAARGLDILITELDVQDFIEGGISVRDRGIADIYHHFLAVALDEPRVASLTFWGLSDRYSWWNEPGRINFHRRDGQPGRPLLFDRELRPTPAFDAVIDALEAAPPRQRLQRAKK